MVVKCQERKKERGSCYQRLGNPQIVFFLSSGRRTYPPPSLLEAHHLRGHGIWWQRYDPLVPLPPTSPWCSFGQGKPKPTRRWEGPWAGRRSPGRGRCQCPAGSANSRWPWYSTRLTSLGRSNHVHISLIPPGLSLKVHLLKKKRRQERKLGWRNLGEGLGHRRRLSVGSQGEEEGRGSGHEERRSRDGAGGGGGGGGNRGYIVLPSYSYLCEF